MVLVKDAYCVKLEHILLLVLNHVQAVKQVSTILNKVVVNAFSVRVASTLFQVRQLAQVALLVDISMFQLERVHA